MCQEITQCNIFPLREVNATGYPRSIISLDSIVYLKSQYQLGKSKEKTGLTGVC